jgi:hypothetical protein
MTSPHRPLSAAEMVGGMILAAQICSALGQDAASPVRLYLARPLPVLVGLPAWEATPANVGAAPAAADWLSGSYVVVAAPASTTARQLAEQLRSLASMLDLEAETTLA